MRVLQKVVVSGLVSLLTFGGAASSSSAQQVIENIITIPVDSILRAPEDSITSVGSAPVPAEFQGSSCVAEVETDNQESVHPDNNLIISSGDTSGTVFDFESEAFGVTGAEIPLTLGSTVDVSLQMGPAEVSSGGVIITIDCTQITPPEPTVPETTEPTVPETTEPTVPETTEPTVPETTEPTVPETPTTTDSVEALPPGQTPTPPSQTPAPTLPTTGPGSTTWTALAAIALLFAGGSLTLLARRQTSSSTG